jgi:hypothetical protein
MDCVHAVWRKLRCRLRLSTARSTYQVLNFSRHAGGATCTIYSNAYSCTHRLTCVPVKVSTIVLVMCGAPFGLCAIQLTLFVYKCKKFLPKRIPSGTAVPAGTAVLPAPSTSTSRYLVRDLILNLVQYHKRRLSATKIAPNVLDLWRQC